jgi:hypothetical protein
MKVFITLLLLAVSFGAVAQRPDLSAQCKEEMKKLSYFAGDWKGQAKVKNPNGELTLLQTEHIEWKLDGLVLSIEGSGRDQEKIVFQALAVINFDPIDRQFKFKSFVKEGYSTNAYFKMLEENKYEWGFDIPTGGKTRYTITLNPVAKTWQEIGEYSRDGTTWFSFIELNLVKL